MVVAVGAMGKVQVAADDIVHMVAMRNGLMPAARSVAMAALMFVASVCRGAGSRILAGDGERMLVHVVPMDVVQVAVVEIVGMIIMGDGLVSAVRSMLVAMMVVDCMVAHDRTPSGTLVRVNDVW